MPGRSLLREVFYSTQISARFVGFLALTYERTSTPGFWFLHRHNRYDGGSANSVVNLKRDKVASSDFEKAEVLSQIFF